jgi:hypothetical protein
MEIAEGLVLDKVCVCWGGGAGRLKGIGMSSCRTTARTCWRVDVLGRHRPARLRR